MAAPVDKEERLQLDYRDLGAEARAQSFGVRFRDKLVAELRALVRDRVSFVLVGPSGVGKSSIIAALAERLDATDDTATIFHTSVFGIIAGAYYSGEWETKLKRLIEEAKRARAALAIADLWNALTGGRTSQTTGSVFDGLRGEIESRRLVVIGEATPELMKKMAREPGMMALFRQVTVPPLGEPDVDAILAERYRARAAEPERQALADGPLPPAVLDALRRITARFTPRIAPPGPSIALVEQTAAYQIEKRGIGEDAPLGPELVERVFSIYSGLPLFIVSPRERRSAGEIRTWFEERLVGQRRAILAIVEAITLFKAGLQDPKKPVGTFLFVGPTGVGKTELARLLATYLYGSPQRMLRFDCSELAEYDSYQLLVGDPDKPEHPARLLDPVRVQPFQVILFDEIEKGHVNLRDLLLQILDEGRLSGPDGDLVDMTNTLVIVTSNVGARDSEKSLGFSPKNDAADRAERTRSELEKVFRPEFLNRFQHITVFDALGPNELRQVARAELAHILGREGITQRNLIVDVADDVLDQVIADGVDPRYGARALKREIQRRVVLPLALAIMEEAPGPGALLQVLRDVAAAASPTDFRVKVTDTTPSPTRGPKKRREPKPDDPEPVALPERLAAAEARLAALSDAIDAGRLHNEAARIESLRGEPAFYSDAHRSSLELLALDGIRRRLGRLAHFGDRVAALAALAASAHRSDRQRAQLELEQLDQALDKAEREWVRMGPDGEHDAIVEVALVPGGAGAMARDFLVRLYLRWAEQGEREVTWLRDPLDELEPAVLAIGGPHAFGLLRLEAGRHLVSEPVRRGAVRVRVGPWRPLPLDAATPSFGPHAALKAQGTFGGKVRSRVACDLGLVLQNGLTLAENRERARLLWPSWQTLPAPSEEIVRRYDLEPQRVRDILTGLTSERTDVLGPAFLAELLELRVDRAAVVD
ncbi:MAG: AAA family ATPase [Myxococcota bacterium]